MAHKICMEHGAYLMAALGFLILPWKWMAGAILAATFHELAHLLVLWLQGGQVLGLRIGAAGAKIETMPMERGREALCALVGPLGSLLTAWVLARLFPEAALCALMQGLFNLLPIYPLDGGRVFRCIACHAACAAVEIFALLILAGLGVWLSVTYNLGILPMIPVCVAVLQRIPRKIPCKESKVAVQ